MDNRLSNDPKILVIATLACSYPGIDNAGQNHLEYPTSVFVIRVPDPVIFPPEFYIRVFEMGYDGILIASCGTDSPYKGTYEKLSKRIDAVYKRMHEKGIEIERLKLTAVCTVCAEHYVKEVREMCEKLKSFKQRKVAELSQ